MRKSIIIGAALALSMSAQAGVITQTKDFPDFAATRNPTGFGEWTALNPPSFFFHDTPTQATWRLQGTLHLDGFNPAPAASSPFDVTIVGQLCRYGCGTAPFDQEDFLMSYHCLPGEPCRASGDFPFDLTREVIYSTPPILLDGAIDLTLDLVSSTAGFPNPQGTIHARLQDTRLSLTYTVPEPSTIELLLLCLAIVFLGWRLWRTPERKGDIGEDY